MQSVLAQEFARAIELEQKSDLLLTTSYLDSYSPRKLASFGLAIVNLVMSNLRTGIAGKTVLELLLDPAFSNPDEDLPSGSIRVGDIVKVDRMDSGEENSALEGVVTKVTNKLVVISVPEDADDEHLIALYNNTGNDNIRMWIVKLTNSVTYKRMQQAMTRLSNLKESDKSEVIRILLGESRFLPFLSSLPEIEYFDTNLNPLQKDAIAFAIYKSPVTIVHGPPGTGKTYTLIELIKQLKFKHGERILVCGASNISVDNILERLSPSFSDATPDSGKQKARKRRQARKSVDPEKLIRIGHPARLLQANLQHSLDVLSKPSYDGDKGGPLDILKDISKDIGETLASIKKCKRYAERRALWAELKSLKREMREREKKVTQDLLVNADVVLATLHGSGANSLWSIYKDLDYSADHPFFDTIIIDEVSQSLEPQCWIALVNHLGCRRLVIAGDNKQLPATVESKEEAENLRQRGEKIADLERTLFDRLVEDCHGDEFRKMLNVQYRMNELIMEFPSKSMYSGALKAGEKNKDILLSDLPDVKLTEDTSVPCVWYDTQGGDFPEQIGDENDGILAASMGSKYNDMETAVVLQHTKRLVAAGVAPKDIGVISPYSAQISAIKRLFAPIFEQQIEISTIDGFQGREKEAIIVSLVRSNDNREVGFLNDYRRLNVAMTRPKRHLCIVGDMELLGQSGVRFLKEWSEYADASFDIRYPDMTTLEDV